MNAPDLKPDDLEPYWMPFTDNRKFKQSPRMVTSAKGMYYRTSDGKEILDGLATLWCVNAGHCHPRIVEAIRAQAGELDFASSFSMSHPLPFQTAKRIAALAPGDLNHVFFANSGSEAERGLEIFADDNTELEAARLAAEAALQAEEDALVAMSTAKSGGAQ